jgi:hypothetical protein
VEATASNWQMTIRGSAVMGQDKFNAVTKITDISKKAPLL